MLAEGSHHSLLEENWRIELQATPPNRIQRHRDSRVQGYFERVTSASGTAALRKWWCAVAACGKPTALPRRRPLR